MIWVFGWFIVNSDMYVGNLLFYLFELLFVLMFVYDMLLMVYVLNSVGMLCDVVIEVKFDFNVSKSVWLMVILLV